MENSKADKFVNSEREHQMLTTARGQWGSLFAKLRRRSNEASRSGGSHLTTSGGSSKVITAAVEAVESRDCRVVESSSTSKAVSLESFPHVGS